MKVFAKLIKLPIAGVLLLGALTAAPVASYAACTWVWNCYYPTPDIKVCVRTEQCDGDSDTTG